MTMLAGPRFDRRRLLRGSLVAGGLAATGATWRAGSAFAFVPARPEITHGVQCGDVTESSGVVWARADRPSRMLVEASATPSFRRSVVIEGPVLTPATDLTGKVRLRGLRPGREVFYRVQLEDLDDPWVTSAPVRGSFVTAPQGRRRDVSFVWGADVVGQGWGINPDIGGLRIFRAMEAVAPDFFLCSGDMVYADNPLAETVTLPDGRVWRNLTTPAKSKVAETLDEFRGQFAYNLLDDNLRSFAARVPFVHQWDDHEVLNNWYPGEIIDDARYTERNVDVLAARSKRAFFEWLPITPGAEGVGRIHRKLARGPLLDVFVLDMRTYKDPNGDNRYADPTRGLLGAEQREWLKRELVAPGPPGRCWPTTSPSGCSCPTAPPGRPSPRAIPARRWAASWRSPTSSPTPTATASPASSPSRPTSTTRPRTSTIPRAPRSPTSRRSGSSSPARSTPARSARTSSTPRSAPRPCSSPRRPRPTPRRSTASSGSGTCGSTARPAR